MASGNRRAASSDASMRVFPMSVAMAGVVDVLVGEVGLVQGVVFQGNGRGVGHTVVGGLTSLGVILFLVAGHDVDGLLEGADVDVGDIGLVEVGHLTTGFQSGLHDGL